MRMIKIMIIIKIKITDKQTKITRIKIMMVKTYNHLHVDDVRCLVLAVEDDGGPWGQPDHVLRGLQGGGGLQRQPDPDIIIMIIIMIVMITILIMISTWPAG